MTNFPFLPTIILENKFTSEQLSSIQKEIFDNSELLPYVHDWEGTNFGKTLSIRHKWEYHKNTKISTAINLALPNVIKDNAIIPISYLLESFIPYEIHDDYNWLSLEETEIPYYLIIIPLLTCDAKTIILNQQGKYLHFVDYKKDHKPLPIGEQMSEEVFQKYFSHCWPQERPYISIKDIFDWKLGNILAFDMRYFHSSDNFLKNGVKEKQCITLMTKIKKDNFIKSYEELTNKLI